MLNHDICRPVNVFGNIKKGIVSKKLSEFISETKKIGNNIAKFVRTLKKQCKLLCIIFAIAV